MIILGVVLLIVGYVLPMRLLVTLGFILVAVGVVLELVGGAGHRVGPWRHYW